MCNPPTDLFLKGRGGPKEKIRNSCNYDDDDYFAQKIGHVNWPGARGTLQKMVKKSRDSGTTRFASSKWGIQIDQSKGEIYEKWEKKTRIIKVNGLNEMHDFRQSPPPHATLISPWGGLRVSENIQKKLKGKYDYTDVLLFWRIHNSTFFPLAKMRGIVALFVQSPGRGPFKCNLLARRIARRILTFLVAYACTKPTIFNGYITYGLIVVGTILSRAFSGHMTGSFVLRRHDCVIPSGRHECRNGYDREYHG